MLFCSWHYMLGFKKTCKKKNFGKIKFNIHNKAFKKDFYISCSDTWLTGRQLRLDSS
jgi:hypothetical protein